MKSFNYFVVLCVCAINSFCFVAGAQSKAAFLSTFSSLEDLQMNGDDDEIAAAEWFVNIYGGDFLSVQDVLTTDLGQYNVIWLAIERPFGFTNFPSELLKSDVRLSMQEYFKAGGNLLLTNYAIKYLNELGRCLNNIWPELWEEGSNTPDDNLAAWGPISTFGKYFSNNPNKSVIDRSLDKLWDGLISEVRTTTETWNQSEASYTIYPLIGAGQKEVHRVVWSMDCDLNKDLEGSIDNPEFLTLFEETYNVEAIGALEYNLAYHRMSIGRWWPQGDYQGMAITISDTGYEWNQNSGDNLYQVNIERLTANALNELGGASTLNKYIYGEVGFHVKDGFVRVERECLNLEIFDLNGNLLKEEKNAVTIDINDLDKGVYILRFLRKSGYSVGKLIKN